MKKILAQILCICLFFSLAACSSKTNEDDIVTVFDAFNETLDANSGILSGKIYYKTDAEQEIDYNIQFIQDGNMQVNAQLDLESEGNKAEDYIHFYIKDGKTYLSNMGTTSQSVASNIGLDTSKKLSVYNPFLDLTDSELESLFKSSEKEDNTYTLVIDPEQLATLLDGIGMLDVSKGTITAVVDNDHLSSLELKITGYMSLEDEDVSSDVEIDLTCKMDQYNSLKEIEYPEDLESY